jgi:hypothetical protein
MVTAKGIPADFPYKSKYAEVVVPTPSLRRYGSQSGHFRSYVVGNKP